jgi:hypothetical protein
VVFLTGYNARTKLLRNPKVLGLIVVQFLITGLLANSLLPQGCLCGGACLHGLQGNTRPSLSFLFHTRCLGTQCKSCNLEEIQTLKAANAAHSTAKTRILVTPSTLFRPSDYHFDIDSVKIIFSRHSKSLKTQSPPTYLQNLSLLI